MQIGLLILLASVATVYAAPTTLLESRGSKGFQKQNGLDAQKLNSQFAKLKEDDPCEEASQACVNGGFAQCVSGKWTISTCSGGTSCFALPLVNKPGTSITCDTPSDALARFMAAGVSDGTGSSNDTGAATHAGKDDGSDNSNNNGQSPGDGQDMGDTADSGRTEEGQDDTSGGSADCDPDGPEIGVNNANPGAASPKNEGPGTSSIITLNQASSTPPSPVSTIVLDRRQDTSGFTSVSVSDSSSPPTSTATPPVSAASGSAILGTDGTATLTVVSTVVSTVTVFMSFVPVSTSGINPIISPGNNFPSAVPSSVSIPNTVQPSTLASASLPFASSAFPTPSIGSASALSSSIASVDSSGVESASQTFQGFSFETTPFATPTTPPLNDNANGAVGSSIDIASLLTATVAP